MGRFGVQRLGLRVSRLVAGVLTAIFATGA
jgi:hypothetical protein